MTSPPWNRRSVVLAGALSLALAGCGLMDAPGTPRLVAHRVGAGHFPENSRSALEAALRLNYPAIEVDVVLSKDRIPLLSHEPWVDSGLCTYAPDSEGAEPRRLPEKPLLLTQDFTLEELQRDFRCGGLGDPATPDAARIPDRFITLEDLFAGVRNNPDMVIQLDIKEDPAYTQSPEIYAEEILSRLNAAALPNRVFISSTRGALIKAFKARQPIEALFIWPEFHKGQNSTLIAIGNELQRKLGFQELIQVTRDAGADGVAVAYQVADRAALEAVRQAGLKTGLWTPNTEVQLETYCRWPLDYLITDYVERASCR